MQSIFIFCATFFVVFGAEIPCSYDDYSIYYSEYSCSVSEAGILVTNENEPITVTGSHIGSYTANDVKEFYIYGPSVLKFVPTKVFETFNNVQLITMYGVGLTTVTTNAFSNCSQLQFIQISSCNFSTLPASFAESCVNLTSVGLYDNNIQTINKDAFKGLTKLEFLSITGNQFTTLDPSTFIHTPNVYNLQISNGKLKTISAELFESLSLWYLFIYDNEITSLPAFKFKNISNVTYLDISHNQIMEIDPDFLKSFPLDREQFYLGLQRNNCTDNTFYGRSELSKLQPCFDNWIKSHTTIKTSTPERTTISSSTTKTSTPKKTTTSSSTTPVITATKLQSNSPSCESCSSHKVCRFFVDHDEVYTCVISGVDLSLQSIGGEHETINGRTFTDTDVKAIFLKKSVLSRVPSAIFEKFPNVEVLSIANTQMTIIDDNTFQSCGNLKKLDVSDNFISTITKTSLQKCQKLETINLSGNPIEDFDSELFKVDPQLKRVILIQKP